MAALDRAPFVASDTLRIQAALTTTTIHDRWVGQLLYGSTG